jgi:hypothetical protein
VRVGAAVTVMMRKIEVPLRVKGRHWGRFSHGVIERRANLTAGAPRMNHCESRSIASIVQDACFDCFAARGQYSFTGSEMV